MEQRNAQEDVYNLDVLDDLLDEFEDDTNGKLESEFEHLLNNTKATTDSLDASALFANEVSQIIERLNEAAEGEGDGALSQLFDIFQAALAEGTEEGTDDRPALDGLESMESLNIKDILLDPIKQLDSLYNSWMESNGESALPQYTLQAKIIKNLKIKLEDSLFNEGELGDQEFVMENLRELQELGDPPKKIMEQMGTENQTLEFLEEACNVQ